MSYTGTQAISGFGAVISVYTTTGVPTSPSGTNWTAIGEIVKPTVSGAQNKDADATNLESAAEEFIATIKSSGQLQAEVNRVSSDAGQTQVQTNYNAGTLNYYSIVLPKQGSQTVSGDGWVIRSLVKEFSVKELAPDQIVRNSFVLKISGAWQFYAGS